MREAILDSDILIALGKAACYALLEEWPSVEFRTTEVNLREMRKPESRNALEEAAARSIITILELDSLEAIELFAKYRIRADPGESAVVAAAVLRKAIPASHDKKAKLLASLEQPPLPVATLDDIVVEAVRLNKLPVSAIHQLASDLVAKKDYVLFKSGIPSPTALGAWKCPW